MKNIFERLQALESITPASVTVTYPNGTQTDVKALQAFEIAVHNKDVVFTVPGNSAMEKLLCAVANAVTEETTD